MKNLLILFIALLSFNTFSQGVGGSGGGGTPTKDQLKVFLGEAGTGDISFEEFRWQMINKELINRLEKSEIILPKDFVIDVMTKDEEIIEIYEDTKELIHLNTDLIEDIQLRDGTIIQIN